MHVDKTAYDEGKALTDVRIVDYAMENIHEEADWYNVRNRQVCQSI